MPWTPLDETSIANLAIDVLDDLPIASLDIDKPVARFMKRNLWVVASEVLYDYPWSFAREYAALPSTTAPAFGWKYAYQLPSDCVRPQPLRYNGEWNAPIIPYEIVGDKIFTNAAAPLKFIYIKRVTNPALFTPPFARVLAMTLALYAAQNITGKASYVDKATMLLRTAWENGKLAETLSAGTPETQQRSDIVDIRGVGLPPATGLGTISAIAVS